MNKYGRVFVILVEGFKENMFSDVTLPFGELHHHVHLWLMTGVVLFEKSYADINDADEE